MPHKFEREKVRINNPKLNKRVKLFKEDKIEIIKLWKDGMAQRALARLYKVSRRLISFIIFPERQIVNMAIRKEKGGSKQYYDREKNNKYTAVHRKYVKELYEKGLIG